jgi:hypothetical protein
MSVVDNASHPISLWRAKAVLGGNDWTDRAYGFGGPDAAEAVGTAEQIGSELTRFFDSLGWPEVEAQRLRTGRFFVRVEVDPQEQGRSTLPIERFENAAEDRVPLWEASAGSGSADGVFDACYSYGNTHGDEGHLLGTAQELGAELTRVLHLLTRGDIETMMNDTERFFIELVIELPRSKSDC